ncbi:MAG: hypothetical protein Q8P74_00575 [bacterium]|nr:hypothetical protein [bacterium]
MKKKRLPNGLRKFIRQEKSRIRRGSLSQKEKGETIKKLYENK